MKAKTGIKLIACSLFSWAAWEALGHGRYILQRTGWVEVEFMELHAALGMILVYMQETKDVFASGDFEAVTTSCMCMGWS